MSGTDTENQTDKQTDSGETESGVTKEAVARAAAATVNDPAALTAAVAASHADAAPSDPIVAELKTLGARLRVLEAHIGLVAPVVEQATAELLPYAESAIPTLGPILSRLAAIEGTVSDVVHSLTTPGQTPQVTAVVDTTATLDPTHPLSRLAGLESTLEAVLGAVASHFGAGRIPGMPTTVASGAPPIKA